MKNLISSLATLFVTGLLLVSFSSKTGNYTAFGNPDGFDKIPDNLFIPDAFFTKYNLELAPPSNVHIKDWSTIDRTAKIGIVDDVRWEFSNTTEAMAYHKKNLGVNSDHGDEMKDKVIIPGAQELHIYGESKSIADLNKSMGINTHEYYFLFTVDKVVAKVFVSVNGDVPLDDAAVFAKEAAKDIKIALGK